MANTTNFGWETPDDTDLVKDGAAAMRTLGNAIDASLVDLKGGTTGQVLSKNTNTDMDFSWVTTDDANAIQNAIVDAKGDLIAASAADTPARLAVGSNGDTLVADSSTTTGLRWQPTFLAGKNKIINGDFQIWQRGSTFTNPNSGAYLADRWTVQGANVPSSSSVTRQTFTPGAAPVAGYEGQYFLRNTITTNTGGDWALLQKVEDVRTLAGRTFTLSFWAKADSNRTLTLDGLQYFGPGGSANVNIASFTVSLTTSWQRFSGTLTVPSISGKTVNDGSFTNIAFKQAIANGSVLDLWGVQLEEGNVATGFQTATGTLAGELAACQRYFWRAGGGHNTVYGIGSGGSTTSIFPQVIVPVTMRTKSPILGYSNVRLSDFGAAVTPSALVIYTTTGGDGSVASGSNFQLNATVAGATAYRPYHLQNADNTAGYLQFDAEL